MPIDQLQAFMTIVNETFTGCEVEATFLAETAFKGFDSDRGVNKDKERAERFRIPIHISKNIASRLRGPPEIEYLNFESIWN